MIPTNGRPSCPLPGYWVARRLCYYGPFVSRKQADEKLDQVRLKDSDQRYKHTGCVVHIDALKASRLGTRGPFCLP